MARDRSVEHSPECNRRAAAMIKQNRLRQFAHVKRTEIGAQVTVRHSAVQATISVTRHPMQADRSKPVDSTDYVFVFRDAASPEPSRVRLTCVQACAQNTDISARSLPFRRPIRGEHIAQTEIEAELRSLRTELNDVVEREQSREKDSRRLTPKIL